MKFRPIAALACAAALLAACGGGSSGSPGGGQSSQAPVKVGIVYSATGLLATYGAQYKDGFEIGLQYATGGTGTVNGHPIEVAWQDDGGEPAKAVSAAKDLIGQGYKILAGATSSAVGLQMAPLAVQNKILFISGPAAADKITGANRYTFRSGRQTYQDILTARSFLSGVSGKRVVVFAQDYAFGQANAAAVKAVLGKEGAEVQNVLVPLDAKDFTPFAQQVKQAGADLVFVAWAGATAGSMWQALDQQGVFASTRVVTGLDQTSSYAAFGPVASKISFLSDYVSDCCHNKANDYLVSADRKEGKVTDLFQPDGFVAAQMIVHAVQAADGDTVDKMVQGLQGWKFTAPKGEETVRPQDNAMLQPMFQVRLQQAGSGWQPVLDKTLAPSEASPPSTPFASS
jgi:branched-chain amino acid transport system substrate-binding protein